MEAPGGFGGRAWPRAATTKEAARAIKDSGGGTLSERRVYGRQMGCLGEDGGQRYGSQNGSGESSVRTS